MSLKKSTLAAIAAVSLVAVPTIASAAPAAASKLSVRAAPAKVVRSGAADQRASNIGGGGPFVAILAAVLVAVGIAVAADGSSAPKSP